MNNNPFTLMYGMSTPAVISREDIIDKIINSFTNNNYMYSYLISGIRGTGKTVLLKTVEDELSKRNDWLLININPQGSILASLANHLYDLAVIKHVVGKITLTINLGIITLTRENGESIHDPEIIIEHFLEIFKKSNINILMSIDEVNGTQEFREFINFYQILIGKKYKLYLLMTALQENVNLLINDKAMTFLTRAPKI